MRLPDAPVGTYFDREVPEGVPLRAVGLNLCQTGWVLQGFVERDGSLAATPTLPIHYATLPSGPAEHRDPAIPGQAIVLDFKAPSMRHLNGTLRIVEDGSTDDIMKMTILGAPVGIASAPGLGPQGCFTTGYYQMALGAEKRVGPVSAVWDNKRLHYIGLRLTEQHGIGIWLHLEPTNRQPQNVIRGDLETVGEKPTRFPLRVVFETRRTTVDGVVVDETPATAGKFLAAFVKASPQGPVRVELTDLVFPDWDGPLANATVEVRAEALFVTDLVGPGVPVPSEPRFDAPDATKRPESPPDAPLHVPPANQK